MPAQTKTAKLGPGLVGRTAAPPADLAAMPIRRDRTPADGGENTNAGAADASAGLFYKKGAATAATFRPAYWSYDEEAEGEAPKLFDPEDPPAKKVRWVLSYDGRHEVADDTPDTAADEAAAALPDRAADAGATAEPPRAANEGAAPAAAIDTVAAVAEDVIPDAAAVCAPLPAAGISAVPAPAVERDTTDDRPAAEAEGDLAPDVVAADAAMAGAPELGGVMPGDPAPAETECSAVAIDPETAASCAVVAHDAAEDEAGSGVPAAAEPAFAPDPVVPPAEAGSGGAAVAVYESVVSESDLLSAPEDCVAEAATASSGETQQPASEDVPEELATFAPDEAVLDDGAVVAVVAAAPDEAESDGASVLSADASADPMPASDAPAVEPEMPALGSAPDAAHEGIAAAEEDEDRSAEAMIAAAHESAGEVEDAPDADTGSVCVVVPETEPFVEAAISDEDAAVAPLPPVSLLSVPVSSDWDALCGAEADDSAAPSPGDEAAAPQEPLPTADGDVPLAPDGDEALVAPETDQAVSPLPGDEPPAASASDPAAIAASAEASAVDAQETEGAWDDRAPEESAPFDAVMPAPPPSAVEPETAPDAVAAAELDGGDAVLPAALPEEPAAVTVAPEEAADRSAPAAADDAPAPEDEAAAAEFPPPSAAAFAALPPLPEPPAAARSEAAMPPQADPLRPAPLNDVAPEAPSADIPAAIEPPAAARLGPASETRQADRAEAAPAGPAPAAKKSGRTTARDARQAKDAFELAAVIESVLIIKGYDNKDGDPLPRDHAPPARWSPPPMRQSRPLAPVAAAVPSAAVAQTVTGQVPSRLRRRNRLLVLASLAIILPGTFIASSLWRGDTQASSDRLAVSAPLSSADDYTLTASSSEQDPADTDAHRRTPKAAAKEKHARSAAARLAHHPLSSPR